MKISWKKPKEEKGILVAFNGTLEPLLFWWYQSLRRFSSLPIAFINFGGINKNVKRWCKKSGYYFDNEKYVNYFKKIIVPEKYKKKWKEMVDGDINSIRPYWFAKPIAMLHTPFNKTLYLDIDCEVKSPIDEIFSFLDQSEIGICKDIIEFNNLNNDLEKIIFNSGVIIYKNKSKIIEKWAQLSLNFNHDFFGDQDLLSQIIYEYKYKPAILPIKWNCYKAIQKNKKVNILHWQGGKNKVELFKKIKKNTSLIIQTENFLTGKI